MLLLQEAEDPWKTDPLFSELFGADHAFFDVVRYKQPVACPWEVHVAVTDSNHFFGAETALKVAAARVQPGFGTTAPSSASRQWQRSCRSLDSISSAKTFLFMRERRSEPVAGRLLPTSASSAA